jgi:hypothetical protein
MAQEAGKGDKRRPGDVNLYGEGYDRIFGRKVVKEAVKEPLEAVAKEQQNVVAIQQLELERMSGKNTTK